MEEGGRGGGGGEGESSSNEEGVAKTKPRLSTSSRSSNLILRSQLAVPLSHAHQVPASGIFDPLFAELVNQFSLRVLEYVEGMEDRLFTAQLHEEVRSGRGQWVWS